MEVDAELGMEGWPRGAPSRGVAALRRVCGLLMMDPCRQEEKVTACLSDWASAAAQQPPIYSHKAPAGWVQFSYFR